MSNIDITEMDKPKIGKSAVTLKKKELYQEISNISGYDVEDIAEIFKAYQKIVINNLLQGINVVLPFMGIVKIVRTFIPETYNNAIVRKYGAIDIPNLNRPHRYTVQFTPKVVLSSFFNLLTRDKLPMNEQAIKVKKMPFDKDYRFDFDNIIETQDNLDNEIDNHDNRDLLEEKNEDIE